jgi:ribosomal protein L21E
VATALVYLLQVIDANVFAYMHDFEVSDDITMNVEPAVISPYNDYAFHASPSTVSGQNALGMRIGIRF